MDNLILLRFPICILKTNPIHNRNKAIKISIPNRGLSGKPCQRCVNLLALQINVDIGLPIMTTVPVFSMPWKRKPEMGKKERRKSYHAPPSHSTIENENEVGLKKANHFEEWKREKVNTRWLVRDERSLVVIGAKERHLLRLKCRISDTWTSHREPGTVPQKEGSKLAQLWRQASWLFDQNKRRGGENWHWLSPSTDSNCLLSPSSSPHSWPFHPTLSRCKNSLVTDRWEWRGHSGDRSR